MAKQRYKKLSYAELQQQLSKLRSNGIAGEVPMLDAMIAQAQLQMQTMYTALDKIAAFSNREGNTYLETHDSYSAFDEPHSTKLAREAIQEL